MIKESILFYDQDVLPVDTALNAFFQIETAVKCNDPDFMMIFEEFIADALKYSQFRSKWMTYTHEQKAEYDLSRTSAHNAFIQDCDILARLMNQMSLDVSWRTEIGEERKRIGDFACWLAAIIAIRER
jgi:hypothetical protein